MSSPSNLPLSMKDAPIGVFDSGVGGLTVLRALLAALPHEHFVYLGDTARLPYGTKSAETIARYASRAADKLIGYGVKCIVVACNTASAYGLAAIRAHAANTPVIGVIEPGAEAACAASKSGHIAVIATEGTIRGRSYDEAIHRRRKDAHITALPTPLFVALAEEGLTEGPVAESAAQHYLGPLFPKTNGADKDNGSDTLVLGCTHFPMLAPVIRRVIGPQVAIIDSAETTAQTVKQTLASASLLRVDGNGSLRLLATDGTDRFARVGSAFLGRALQSEQVELVDLH